jgi:DNA polymerase-3 subunit delta
MLLFLYGPDTYRSRKKLNEIIEHYKKIHKSGLNLKHLDGKKLDFQDLKDQFRSVSMFSEKKLIILEEAFTNQNFKENFLKNSKKFVDSKDIILFYETKETPRSDPLFKFLKKYAKSQEFKLLEGKNLKDWVKKEIENYKVKINPIALEKLTDYVGNDLWQMENEIKKLVVYKTGHNQVTTVTKVCRVNLEDVELLVKPKIETDIFKTIDAIAEKNKKRALKFIKAHLEKGDSPFYLFSMINFQFRNLLIIKDLMERNLSPYSLNHLHPYVIKKSISLLEKFSFSELKKIYQKIFQLDLDVKTGKIEPEMALDLLITELPSEAR